MKIKIKVHELEDRADDVFKRAMGNLFKQETDAKEIIKLKDILENLENVMDKFQLVTDTIESVLVKSS